jgi:hypothetical protein
MTWSEELVSTPAMTLREYYAGMAMVGLLSHDGPTVAYRDDLAIVAAQYADALIAELQREAGDE